LGKLEKNLVVLVLNGEAIWRKEMLHDMLPLIAEDAIAISEFYLLGFLVEI
jgi:hypothetical protein